MTVPVVESFDSGFTSNGSFVVVNKPSGTVDGDLLIALYTYSIASIPKSNSVSSPVKWQYPLTVFRPVLINTGSSYTSPTVSVWYKIADSEPASWVFRSVQTSGLGHYCHVIRISGINTDNPFDIGHNTPFGPSVNPDCPDVTTTQSDTLILRLFGAVGERVTTDTGYPASHTGIFVEDSAGTSQGAAYVAQASPGATGNALFTMDSSGKHVGVTLAVNGIAAAGSDRIITGITKDRLGAIVPSVDVALFKNDGGTPPVYTYISSQISDGTTGVYSFTVNDADNYMVYANLPGSPNQFDASGNDVIGTLV